MENCSSWKIKLSGIVILQNPLTSLSPSLIIGWLDHAIRKIAIETSLFYKLAICLPYFVIGQFLLLTVSVNIRLIVKIVRCLVCQATCQFPQKSMSILG